MSDSEKGVGQKQDDIPTTTSTTNPSVPPQNIETEQSSQPPEISTLSESTTTETLVTPPVLKDRGYEIKTLLGGGSFSKVYRGTRTKIDSGDKEIAVKIIDFENVPVEWKEKCLRLEMKLLKRLKHPHIIRVWDIIKTRRHAYIFMELAENDSVAAFMRKEQRACTDDEARLWFANIVGALAYIHGKKVAHRDIKCENILLDHDMNAKLTDFGFACYTYDEITKKNVFSMTTCGTQVYQAPEVFDPPYDPRIADMWSMGVVLFEMLTNTLPFPTDLTPMQLLRQQKKESFRVELEMSKTIKASAKQLVRKLLKVDTTVRLLAVTVLSHPWLSGK